MRTDVIQLSFLASLVSGCVTDVAVYKEKDTPDVIDESPDTATPQTGVDYSFARPSVSALHGEGYGFAARYLSYDHPSTHGKILFSNEAHAIENAGLDLVSNWEYGTSDALGGYSAGVADAQAADQEAAAAGAPPDRPIYFSVDFDASDSQQSAIDAYLDGAASVLGRSRVGLYGGYYVIKRSFDAGKIKFGWQTYAWSGGQWDSRAQLRQVANGITAGGDSSCCDRDTSQARDYGQWSYQMQLVNVNSSKCVDVTLSGTDDGTNIQQWTCNGTGAQGFRITPHGDAWMLVNTNSGKCVDVAYSGTSNGTNIQLWTCNGSSAQLFRLATEDGHTVFVNTNSDKCIDVTESGTDNGTNVQLWTCNGTKTQQFIVKQQ
jgi:hypothetical protein